MYNSRYTAVLVLISLLVTTYVNGDTLRLDSEGSWKSMDGLESGTLEKQIVNFKKLISENKPDELQKLAEEIKKVNPEVGGDDFDAFVEAEVYFADQKYLKAAKKYQDFLELYPQSQLYQPVMERLYDISVLFLNGQKVSRLKILRMKAYEEAAKIMQNISEKAGNKPIAKRSLITLAQSYEKRGKYIDAYQVWSDISSRWPTSDTAQQALLGMARSLHSSYRGYKFNSTNLESAKSYYRDFMLRYPVQAKEINLDEQLSLIEEQKAYKEFKVAQYYQKSGDKLAAGLYYQSVIDQWPKSSAAQLAKQQLREMHEKKPKDKRTLWGWWFNPKDQEKMFIVELP